MSDAKQKTERKITPKGFLSKATKPNVSAAGFLTKYREYMTTGELSSALNPIIKKIDDGELLPTPGLREIQNATLTHIINMDTMKAETAIENAGQPAIQKSWVATVYNAEGLIQQRTKDNGEIEDLVKGFDVSSDADRWCDRRLFDGAPDWYAEIKNAKMNVSTIILRDDAIARILKKSKGPAVHQRGQSTKTLGFGVRAKQDRASFSRG